MATDDDETITSRSRLLPHAEEHRPHGVADTDGEALEKIDNHLRRFIGEPANVLHELVSDLVHIDVHIIAPCSGRDCYTLVTTGMSDLPMTTPPGLEELRYAELLISLPPTWARGPAWLTDPDDETLYWPIRLLKSLARLPHRYATWLGYGHTIPNGDPPEPYAPNTQLCGALVIPSITAAPEFARLSVRPGKAIHFYAVVPLYEWEMHFKLEYGADALVENLLNASVTEILDPTRLLRGKKKRIRSF